MVGLTTMDGELVEGKKINEELLFRNKRHTFV